MLQRLRSRLNREEGFTLIELLVVILIIGILAAIAIPSFLNQRGKGEDAEAKSGARTAQTAFETSYTDYGNYFCGAANAAGATDAVCDPILRDVEENLPDAADLTVTGTATGYVVSVVSDGERTFTITKNGATVDRTCDVGDSGNNGGCQNVNAEGEGTW